VVDPVSPAESAASPEKEQPQSLSGGHGVLAESQSRRAFVLRAGPNERRIKMPATTPLYCQVEIPKGAVVSRAGVHGGEPGPWSGLRYPADWCYFRDTCARDGAPLRAIVCATQPSTPGRQIAVKPIALLRVHDARGVDEIIVCGALEDVVWRAVDGVDQIPDDLRKEIECFVMSKGPNSAHGAIDGWLPREDAMTAIDDAAARWAAAVNGRG